MLEAKADEELRSRLLERLTAKAASAKGIGENDAACLARRALAALVMWEEAQSSEDGEYLWLCAVPDAAPAKRARAL